MGRETEVASQITHGLIHIHQAGLVHGDYRCRNRVGNHPSVTRHWLNRRLRIFDVVSSHILISRTKSISSVCSSVLKSHDDRVDVKFD